MATITANYKVKRTGLRANLYKANGEACHTAKLFCPSDERTLRRVCEDLVRRGDYERFEIVTVTVETQAGD